MSTTRLRSAPGARGARRASIAIARLCVALLAAACAEETPEGPTCAADQVACGQQCVDVSTSPTSCGGCGIPCGTGQLCLGGACQCESGVLCNGACFPAAASPCDGEGALGDPPTLVTSAPGAYWNTGGPLTEVTSGEADVTVLDTSTAQVWEGFGGAFNELGWSYLSLLGESDRSTAIRLLYGADGARFAFGRIPIGASDYALDRYTLDETAGDAALTTFSIDRDMQRLIPYVKAAQAVKGNIRLWASPWTPPTWMKDGPFHAGNAPSPFDGGEMKRDDATLEAYARYLIEFVRAYAAQGIVVEAISPQNEPSYTGNYPTCAWERSTYTKLIGQHLGPAAAEAGLPTKIMLGTFNGGGGDAGIVGSVMGDAAARAYVGILGYQWGMKGRLAGSARYHLPMWQTEHQAGNYPWDESFDRNRAPNDQAYAVESWGLIRDWIRAGATAYSAWNLVLDTTGVGIDTTRAWPQNALLTVDTSTKTLNVTPTYHVFRHVSQFVTPGAKVVATSGGDALAFKNPDGAVVTVLYNAGSSKVVTVAAAGRKLRFAMPAGGWATLVAR